MTAAVFLAGLVLGLVTNFCVWRFWICAPIFSKKAGR